MKIVTFGCRINTYESARIKELASGLDDVICINTCAVTAEAERQCRQTIRKLKKENPDKRIGNGHDDTDFVNKKEVLSCQN